MTTSEADRAGSATPDQPRPLSASAGGIGPRIVSLDFIRGMAVMGILAANIIAYGQPFTAYMYPAAFTTAQGVAEGWMWVAQFVLVDGKMRGLFSLLFGAGIYLFMERAWARGATRWLQVRRLLWLGLFGLFHFFFLWRGDILFLYACSGLVALLFARVSRRDQFVIGLLGYAVGAVALAGATAPMQLVADTSLGEQARYVEMAAELEAAKQADLRDGRSETALMRAGAYRDLVSHTFTHHADDLAVSVMMFWRETLPLMLMGMALYRKGLFDGSLDARRQRLWGWAGLALGGTLSLLVALWARGTGFTYYATLAAFTGWAPLPQLMMTLGLAALLPLWAQRATAGWLGQRVSAAGRTAFTNYLGTSLAMMLVFHGWAGGLFGQLGRGQLYVLAVLAWIIMLAWSQPWLARFRYGPLEWLWRCLTYRRMFELRR